MDAIESVDALGCNRVSSLFSSSSSSSSSGSNDAARSNRSFLSSRGSNDENEGGRDEIGMLTGAEGDEYVLSFTVALLGYTESSSLADTWNRVSILTSRQRIYSFIATHIACNTTCKSRTDSSPVRGEYKGMYDGHDITFVYVDDDLRSGGVVLY